MELKIRKNGDVYIIDVTGEMDLYNSYKLKELVKLEKEGISGLVIDVRGNSGGYLTTVTDIASYFLKKGDIIYKLEVNDKVTVRKDKTKESRDYPVAVLIDKNSASASEILASSIKESYNGYVVGTNSYGKGTVQQTLVLSDGSMIKYTIEKWLTPLGNWINEEGVIPTNYVELSSEYLNNPVFENDNQLNEALELASKCNATVVYTSTNEIYGNAIANEVFTEDYNGKLNLSNARSCYNESKRTAESLCQSYIVEKNVNVKIARLCRIFGPTMLESDSKASSQFIKKAINNEDIVLKSEGNQYFSYTYVADAVIGLLQVLLHGETGVAYNVSSEKTNIHLKDFAQLCADYNHKKVIFDLPSAEERKGYSIAMKAILSNERIKGIGFKPMYSMQDAICRTCKILCNE